MGGANEARESSEKEGVGEVMVEIFGSDVFVNGVTGQKEGCLASGEFGDLEGLARENKDDFGGGNILEVVDGDESREGDAGGSWEFDLISDEKAMKDEGVEKVTDENLMISGVLTCPMEASAGGDFDQVDKEGADCLSDYAQVNYPEGETLSTCDDKGGVLGAKVENASSSGDFVMSETVEEKVVAAESGDSILEKGSLVPEVLDENHGLREFCDVQTAEVRDGLNFEIQCDTEINRLNVEQISLKGSLPSNDKTYFSRESCACDEENQTYETEENSEYINRNQPYETEENSEYTNRFYVAEDHAIEINPMDVEDENESEDGHNGECTEAEIGEEPESEAEAPVSKTQIQSSDEKTMRLGRVNLSRYLFQNEVHFFPSDLVWGKVRSHPWWPGQIFDPSHASEKALKYQKKEDSYLVAYFGDGTFAWNEESKLKPFGSHFSQMEKQSKSETFKNAVDSALEEVSRRVELGLSCACVPKDDYSKIEAQLVENAGICHEYSKRYGVDHSAEAHYHPDKLLDYISDLATYASSGADKLDLAIAHAQLSAFCRFKGYHALTEFVSCGELPERAVDREKTSRKKQKRDLKTGSKFRKKEKSLVDITGDGPAILPDAKELPVNLPSGGKRKATDSKSDRPKKRASAHAAKVTNLTSQSHTKASFKIGDCIRRSASRLLGPTSTVQKGNGDIDEMVIDDGSRITLGYSENENMFVSEECLSVDEMLLTPELVAQSPKDEGSFEDNDEAFFMNFRNSLVFDRFDGEKRAKQAICGLSEEFEFDDLNEFNSSEEKSVKSGRKLRSRKRLSNRTVSLKLYDETGGSRRVEESSPAELILNFAEKSCVQSEINLNKIFRRFGPLMESETHVDHELGLGKVIFKRACDAEVARDSAGMFNIFGPSVVVSYEICYSPVISVKILPVGVPPLQCPDIDLGFGIKES